MKFNKKNKFFIYGFILVLFILISSIIILKQGKDNVSYAFENDKTTRQILNEHYKNSCILIVGDTLFTNNTVIGPNNIALAGTRYAKNNSIAIDSITDEELNDFYKEITYSYCGISYKMINGQEEQIIRLSKYSNEIGDFVDILDEEKMEILDSVSFIKYIDNTNISNETQKSFTILNVPLDSRPVTRQNLKDLIETSGMDYIEVGTDNLDSHSSVDGYQTGTPSEVMKDFETKLKSNNNTSTKSIVNLTSLFYGGLVAQHVSHDDEQIENNITNLSNLVKKYNNVEYYAFLPSPRTLPDFRKGLNYYPEKYNDSFAKGLVYYYFLEKYPNAEEVAKSACINNYDLFDLGFVNENCEVGIAQAILEYEYALWYEKYNEDVPSYFETFKNNFKNDYADIIKKYEDMFVTYETYVQNLVEIQKENDNFNFLYGINDYQLPDIINYFYKHDKVSVNIKFGGYKLDENTGEIIKYSRFYKYLTESILEKEESLLICDEASAVIAAKLALDNYNNLYSSNNYINIENINGIENDLGHFDILSNSQMQKNILNFINSGVENGEKEINNLIYYIYPNSQNDYSEIINLITKSNYNLKDLTVIDISQSNNAFSYNNVLGQNKDIRLYDYSIITGWNTKSNSLGLGIAKSAIVSLFKEEYNKINDIKENDKNYERLKSYIKLKLNTIIEDSFHNEFRNNYWRECSLENYIHSCFGWNGQTVTYNIDDKFNTYAVNFDKNYEIGNLKYKIDNYEYNYSLPWERNFEPLIETTNLDITIIK